MPASARSLQAETSVLPGLQAAVDSICQCTDIQHEKRTSLSDNSNKVCRSLLCVILNILCASKHSLLLLIIYFSHLDP